MTLKKIIPDELTGMKLLELETCSRCSHCAEYCPSYLELKRVGLIPGKKVESLLKLVKSEVGLLSKLRKSPKFSNQSLEAITNDIYDCSLCGRCMTVCPFGIETLGLWESFRSILYRLDKHPAVMKEVDKAIKDFKNPYGVDNETRALWVDYFSLQPAPINKHAKIAYFVGCTSSFKSPGQDIAYATALILNHVNEDWTLLGSNEWCCGGPLLMIGNKETAKEVAIHNIEAIEALGVELVVSSCPGCVRTLKYAYPRLARKPNFDVMHTTELFNQYFEKGRLKVENKSVMKVAYHDPCELVRLHGVINEPRRLLNESVGRFIELPENKNDVRCCGGGGVLQAVNDDLRLKMGVKRVEQALNLGTELLTSACPACKITLMDSVKKIGGKIKVMDVNELLAQRLNLI